MKALDRVRLKRKLDRATNISFALKAAKVSKYLGPVIEVNHLIVEGALRHIKSAKEAVDFAKAFMSYAGQHLTINMYAETHHIFIQDISILLSGLDFRADKDEKGLAQTTADLILAKALPRLDEIQHLERDELVALALSMTYDISKKYRLIYGNAITTALLKRCECPGEVVDCQKYLPTYLERNEILIGYALSNPNLSEADFSALMDSIDLGNKDLATQTKINLERLRCGKKGL